MVSKARRARARMVIRRRPLLMLVAPLARVVCLGSVECLVLMIAWVLLLLWRRPPRWIGGECCLLRGLWGVTGLRKDHCW